MSAGTIASYVSVCCRHLGLSAPDANNLGQDIHGFIGILKTEFTSDGHVLVRAPDLFDRLNALAV